MLAEAFQEIVMGLSRFKAAIADLEKEHKNTQETILSLQKRIQVLEETSAADGIDVELIDRILSNYDLESKIETIVEDKIESALDMRLDDAIESAMSGREVEINFNGTVTL
jgi:hypothetical protein